MSNLEFPNIVMVEELDQFSNLLEENNSINSEVDILCANIDSEKTPYKSKYKARELLEGLNKKLEATKAIAVLENKKSIVNEVNCLLASNRIKLATIAYDCDEYHNTETELELASKYYFPDLYKNIISLTNQDDIDETKNEQVIADVSNIESIVPNLPLVYADDNNNDVSIHRIAVDILKCLNSSGILWAGRGRVKRSFMFFYSSYNFYKFYQPQLLLYSQSENESQFNKSTLLSEIESAHTHNLFYLAQAYGHLHNTTKSSYFCHLTLQRQLTNDNIQSNIKLTINWVKNALGMAHYYFTYQNFIKFILTLQSCDKIFHDYVLIHQSSMNKNTDLYITISELQGEIMKKYVVFYTKLLKVAFEREISRLDDPEIEKVWSNPNQPSIIQTYKHLDEDINILIGLDPAAQIEYFAGLPISYPTYYSPNQISSFEIAREIFLLAVNRIEKLKKIFPMDGYVTEHVEICLQNSKLFHYLSIFEKDLKRKFAMENRRIDLLLTIVTSISPTAYDVLHKQLSYELAEVYITLHDVKIELIREKIGGEEINPDKIKKVDIQKCNEFCRIGIAMFTYMLSFYKKKSDITLKDTTIQDYLNMSIEDLDQCACWDPDEELLSAEEIRPFFNCHFLTARLLSKVILTSQQLSSASNKASYIVASLKRYEWLKNNCLKLCNRFNCSVENEFGMELKVCRDMVELLPSKIDMVHFRKGGGFAI